LKLFLNSEVETYDSTNTEENSLKLKDLDQEKLLELSKYVMCCSYKAVKGEEHLSHLGFSPGHNYNVLEFDEKSGFLTMHNEHAKKNPTTDGADLTKPDSDGVFRGTFKISFDDFKQAFAFGEKCKRGLLHVCAVAGSGCGQTTLSNTHQGCNITLSSEKTDATKRTFPVTKIVVDGTDKVKLRVGATARSKTPGCPTTVPKYYRMGLILYKDPENKGLSDALEKKGIAILDQFSYSDMAPNNGNAYASTEELPLAPGVYYAVPFMEKAKVELEITTKVYLNEKDSQKVKLTQQCRVIGEFRDDDVFFTAQARSHDGM